MKKPLPMKKSHVWCWLEWYMARSISIFQLISTYNDSTVENEWISNAYHQIWMKMWLKKKFSPKDYLHIWLGDLILDFGLLIESTSG